MGVPSIIGFIALPEIGFIIGIAVIIFGCTAVMQNPFISILWYYYVFYMKNKE